MPGTLGTEILYPCGVQMMRCSLDGVAEYANTAMCDLEQVFRLPSEGTRNFPSLRLFGIRRWKIKIPCMLPRPNQPRSSYGFLNNFEETNGSPDDAPMMPRDLHNLAPRASMFNLCNSPTPSSARRSEFTRPITCLSPPSTHLCIMVPCRQV